MRLQDLPNYCPNTGPDQIPVRYSHILLWNKNKHYIPGDVVRLNKDSEYLYICLMINTGCRPDTQNHTINHNWYCYIGNNGQRGPKGKVNTEEEKWEI